MGLKCLSRKKQQNKNQNRMKKLALYSSYLIIAYGIGILIGGDLNPMDWGTVGKIWMVIIGLGLMKEIDDFV